MRSSIRRFRNLAGPPIPLTPKYRAGGANIFDLGSGRMSREQQLRSYGMSGTVFSIVSLLQEASASPTWHLFKASPIDSRRRYSVGDQGSDQRVEVVQHAALSLWNQPNSFMDGFTFREGANQHLELTGETIWALNREGTTFPTALWYVRPDRMEPIPSPEDYLVGWIYTADNGENVPLYLDEVIIEKRPDPLDPLRGMGPVASIMPNIQQQRYATEFQRNLFLNGADPGGVITVPTKLSDRDFDELVDRWREGHQGIARAGRVGILEQGAAWTSAGQSNKDLEYGNLRLANRDELREAWRLHKAMLGTSDDVNRANAQTAQEVFTGWQTIPRLERRKSTLNFKLLPMFGQGQEKLYEFDYEPPEVSDPENAAQELLAKANAAKALIQAGYDPTDVLETVGLPDMKVLERAVQLPLEPPPGWSNPSGNTGSGAGTESGSHAGGGGGDSGDPNHDPTNGKFTSNRQYVELVRNAKDPQAKVLQQLAKDYPPEAIAWAHHADWSGPASLPTSHIEPDMKWLDLTDPNHVSDFVEQIIKGKKLKPVIAVKTPKSSKPKLVDGHHRYLADEQMDRPVRAYIATVKTEHGPWEQMHDHQYEGDEKPQNRLTPQQLRPYTTRALGPASLNRGGD